MIPHGKKKKTEQSENAVPRASLNHCWYRISSYDESQRNCLRKEETLGLRDLVSWILRPLTFLFLRFVLSTARLYEDVGENKDPRYGAEDVSLLSHGIFPVFKWCVSYRVSYYSGKAECRSRVYLMYTTITG